MKNYELLYILPSNMTGKEIATNFKEINKNIEKFGGTMLETLVDHPFLIKNEISKEEEAEELRGLTIIKKKLAYPIEKNKIGFYCLVNFSIAGEKLKELDTYLKMNASILRHLIVQEDPMSKEGLAELQKLFARKRAEQEKEEKEGRKEEIRTPKKEERVERKEVKPEVKDEVKEEKKEIIKEETKEIVKEEKKEDKETAKEEEKEEKTKKAAKKVKEEKTEKEEEEKEEKKDEKKGKKKDDGRRKKKIKLEDLEDKLDEILEDTMV